jgi:hypothetical protein
MASETSARTVPPEVQGHPHPGAADRLSSSGAATFATLAVFLVSAVALVVRWRGNFTPIGDLAITELTVREVGSHAVLLGPYSRFQWWHPGPMLWYLLAIPYRLLGGSSIGTSVGAALISGVAAAGTVFTAGRIGGRRLAWWSALVVGIYVWAMGPELLRYPWNPYLTVLPVALLTVLAWAAACGQAWAIPTGLGTATFLVQSHVGYAPVAAAVVLVAGGALLVRARTGELAVDGHRLRRAAIVSVVVLVVLWAPPLVEQLQHDPGNLRALWRFFREHQPDHTLRDGLSTTFHGLGTVAEQLVAHRTGFGVERVMPAWSNVLTVGALVAATVLGVRRRCFDALTLLALTAVLGLAAIWSVSRIIGPAESYLVQWITVISPIAWIAIGAVAIRVAPAARGRGLGIAVVAATLALVMVNAWSSVQALGPDSVPSPEAHRFSDRLVAAIPRDSRQPVLVEIADQQAWPWAATAVLALEKAGIPVRVDREYGWLISGRLGTSSKDFDRVVTLTLAGQPGSTTARADPRQHLVSAGSGVETFLSDRRAGR